MKINSPNIYITSKQIMLSRTQLPNQNLGEALSQWLLFTSNSLTFIGKGRLGAIISTIPARKYSHAIQENEGATETKPALVKQHGCQKELVFSYPHVCAGFWLFQRKAFPGDHSLSFTRFTFVQCRGFTKFPRY